MVEFVLHFKETLGKKTQTHIYIYINAINALNCRHLVREMLMERQGYHLPVTYHVSIKTISDMLRIGMYFVGFGIDFVSNI